MLGKVPFFALLDEKEREFLAAKVNIVRFKPGDVIFSYGDPGNSMYLLNAGHVELTLRNKIGESVVLGRRAVNDFFGEISLLDGGPRTATARAVDDVEAVEVDRGDLDELFRLQPAAALELLSATGSRLRQTTQMLRNASTRNANEDIEVSRTTVVRVTDWIARFSGSLTFLFMHLAYFALWLGWNIYTPLDQHFDEFPYGFLTLVVSLEMVVLSVFVLLSQNRQMERDRVRNEIEYDVNLKAEMQIAHMHEKVDENYAASQKRLDQIERKLELLSAQGKPA
jgi:uncharacterized membrane protein